MVEFTFLQNFMIALALGALIGLEREYARYKKRGHDYAGIRTFPLIALFGALAAYFGEIISVWVLLGSMGLMGVLIIVSYFADVETSRKYHGATSEVAGFITFFVGVLCYYGEYTFAAFIAIVMTIILYARSMLHHFAEHIKKKELADTLKFAVVAFIILPFLPNTEYGPYGLFNPYIVWVMVVFISGISFIGYFLMKWFGEKGLTLTAILGGIASSTALTTSFSERSKKEKSLFQVLALGVIIANGIMLFRVLFVLFFLNKEVYINVLLPFIVLAGVAAGGGYLLWKKIAPAKHHTHHHIELTSPFTFLPALKFALIFATVLALTKLGGVYFADQGVYLISFISGFFDVDTVVISMAQLAGTTITAEVASKGVLLAALTNTLFKGGIAYMAGGREFSKIILMVFGVQIVVGVVLLFLL